jgi:hypothetical protein
MHQNTYNLYFLKSSYMFRPCLVIFRENSLLQCWMHLYSVSENVPLFAKAHSHLTVQQAVLPEDDQAGSKHVGAFYE